MSESDDITEWVNNHEELLSRILASGHAEAQSYALALLANSNDLENVKTVQEELNRILERTDS